MNFKIGQSGKNWQFLSDGRVSQHMTYREGLVHCKLEVFVVRM